MIPIKTIKIGCYMYKLIYGKARVSDTHGQTCTSNKEILIYKDENVQSVKETLQHEILHALLEDVCDSIKDIDDTNKQEEQLIRLLSPRLMSLAQDNPKLVKFLWTPRK